MIFFCVWLRVYSREVLRESFDCPLSSTITGITGILGILVSGCPSMSGLVSLTSFPPLFPTHGAKETNSRHSFPPLPSIVGLLGLTSFPPAYPTQGAKPRNSNNSNAVVGLGLDLLFPPRKANTQGAKPEPDHPPAQ